jgi:hypothetical protein
MNAMSDHGDFRKNCSNERIVNISLSDLISLYIDLGPPLLLLSRGRYFPMSTIRRPKSPGHNQL